MTSMIKLSFLLFLVTITGYTQEPLIVGRRYYEVYIYSDFHSDAEALAETYLTPKEDAERSSS